MKNNYMTITMTDEEVKANPFVNVSSNQDFYHFIAEKFAPYDEIKSIRCTKINVAKNIQEYWFDYGKLHGIASWEMVMILAMSGPKALDYLGANVVELEDGAIEY